MKRKNLIIGLLIVCFIVFIDHISELNFQDLSWKTNSNSYLGIIAMGCLVLSLSISWRSIKNQEKREN